MNHGSFITCSPPWLPKDPSKESCSERKSWGSCVQGFGPRLWEGNGDSRKGLGFSYNMCFHRKGHPHDMALYGICFIVVICCYHFIQCFHYWPFKFGVNRVAPKNTTAMCNRRQVFFRTFANLCFRQCGYTAHGCDGASDSCCYSIKTRFLRWCDP